MLDIQVPGRGQHLVGGGGRNDGYRVTLGQVGINQGTRFRVDQAGDLPGVELFAHVEVGLFFDAAHELGVDRHHAGKSQTPQTETPHGPHEFEELPGRQVTTAELFADKGCRRVAGDERAVKIENGGDFRAVRRGFDILEELVDGGHVAYL